MKFYTILLCIPAIFSSIESLQQCGINEILNQCGARCEMKCGDPLKKPCPAICDPPQCTCRNNYRREPRTGQCVRPEQCFSSPQPIRCGINESYMTCSSNCEPTCGVENRACTLNCGPPKCQCSTGFKRNPNNGMCVRPSQCPMYSYDPSFCGINEKLVQCPPRCEPSCSNLNTNCPPVCGKPGCVCNSGYVRAPKSNECIKLSECFPTQVPNICQKNENYVTCSNPCEPTCENPNPVCVKKCEAPKCQCATGYVRDTKTGECVLFSQCTKNTPSPVVCQKNENFTNCSNPCEPSCDNKRPTCVKRCGEPKCECMNGFFRNKRNGACVRENRCPIGVGAPSPY